MTDLLNELSNLRARRVASAEPRVLALRVARNRTVSAIHWQAAFVVTSADALQGADEVDVQGSSTGGRASVVAIEPAVDVALLKLTDAVASETPQPTATAPEPGQAAAVVGRCVDGVLASWGSVALSAGAWTSQRGGQLDRRIELDMRLGSRLEGGLVIDSAGGTLGMAVPGPRRRVLCIPSATIDRVLAAVARHGHLPRPYVGVRLQPLWIDPTSATSLDLPAHARSVAVVTAVEAGSPAAAAGVCIGDWLIAAAGAPLPGAPAFVRAIATRQPGDVVELGIQRAGARESLQLRIGDRPR